MPEEEGSNLPRRPAPSSAGASPVQASGGAPGPRHVEIRSTTQVRCVFRESQLWPLGGILLQRSDSFCSSASTARPSCHPAQGTGTFNLLSQSPLEAPVSPIAWRLPSSLAMFHPKPERDSHTSALTESRDQLGGKLALALSAR